MKNKLIIPSLLAICMPLVSRGVEKEFTSEDIKIVNQSSNIVLAGTVTSPKSRSPKAAVVLASGSGAQNRDEEVLGHKPFKTLAEYLSSNGYAVIRLDDRGTGESSGDFSLATIDDFATDISSALNHLDSCYSDIPTGIIGHSEGGIVAVKTSIGNKNCNFIITLAGPAWPGDSIIMSQTRAIAEKALGRWDGEQAERRLLDIAKSSMPQLHAATLMYSIVTESLGEAARIPEVQKQMSGQINAMLSPNYRSFLRYDPADDIRSVPVPWLALNGDRDMQVLPGNLTTIEELNPAVETRLMPSHNHLFQKCTTGEISEYTTIAEDISSETLEEIVRWLDNMSTDKNLNQVSTADSTY